MTATEQLLQEIQDTSEPLIQEVLDFLLFARSRNYTFLQTEIADKQETHLGICSRTNARCPTRRTRQTASR